MTTYTITQTTTGVELDRIEAATALDAYRAHMARVGYPTEAAAQSAGYTLSEIPADVAVVEVETDPQRDDDLAAGIAHVDAYPWRDGYAYDASDEGAERRYLVDECDLVRLGEMLRATDDDARRDAYSHWCAECVAIHEDIDEPEDAAE